MRENTSGFTLVEVVVALFLIGLGVLAAAPMFMFAMQGNAVGGEQTWYADADSDGHGNASNSTSACDAPPDFVSSSDDCNDADGTAYPGATEVCDGDDEDCDSVVDNGVAVTGWEDLETGTLHMIPLDLLEVKSIEAMFRGHLQAKYHTVSGLNRIIGTGYRRFGEIRIPQQGIHFEAFLKLRPWLRRA